MLNFDIEKFYKNNVGRLTSLLKSKDSSFIYSFQVYNYLLNMILPDNELKESNLLYKSYEREERYKYFSEEDRSTIAKVYGKITEILLNHDAFSVIVPNEIILNKDNPFNDNGFLFEPIIVLYKQTNSNFDNSNNLTSLKVNNLNFAAVLIINNTNVFFPDNLTLTDNMQAINTNSFLACTNFFIDSNNEINQSDLFYLLDNSNEIVMPNFDTIKTNYKIGGDLEDKIFHNNILIAHYDHHSDGRKTETYKRDTILLDISNNRVVYKKSQRQDYHY